MPLPETARQRLTLPPADDGRVLLVEFQRRGDRYAHSIVVTQGDQPIYQADSQEGDSQELWPASPALQQLSLQTVAGNRRAALLVGMAGKSHFSLSVTADEARGQITFDVACNFKSQPEFLGSTYRPVDSCQQPSAIEILAEEAIPTRVQDGQADGWVCRPAAETADPVGIGRWCYVIGLR